eukprot:105366-Pyramimonas_sp.AAC.2
MVYRCNYTAYETPDTERFLTRFALELELKEIRRSLFYPVRLPYTCMLASGLSHIGGPYITIEGARGVVPVGCSDREGAENGTMVPCHMYEFQDDY